MKKFIITADASFEAESIDDAFAKLRDYFSQLASGEEPEPLLDDGDLAVEASDMSEFHHG